MTAMAGWREQAACSTADPRLFDATTQAAAVRALAICAGCPVTIECLRSRPHGTDGGLSGVWGGHVYGVNGARLFTPTAVPTQRDGEHVDVCEGCGRPVTSRGRDNCPHEGSLCRRLAAAYHSERYRLRKRRVRRAVPA